MRCADWNSLSMTTSKSLDVVTLGEAMVMLVAGQPGPLEQVETFHKRTAGAETNVAIGLARLGMQVGWGNRLGQDSLGRYLLDSLRGELGAMQHRLGSVITNLNHTADILSQARSRIEDADYAVETSNLTRQQILQQASKVALTQANQLAQNVLALLKED